MTASYLVALVQEAPYILFLRDRPFKAYHFSKLGKEGWAELADQTEKPEDPNLKPALAAFYAEYGLPEHQLARPLHSLARQDMAAALVAGRVAGWVLNMLSSAELESMKMG